MVLPQTSSSSKHFLNIEYLFTKCFRVVEHLSLDFCFLHVITFVFSNYSNLENINNHPLDFEKIKNDLTNLPERKKGFLLQALRWVS